MILEEIDLDEINLGELDQIREDQTRFYLKALLDETICSSTSEDYERKSRRHCFRIGRKLEKILRGEKTYIEPYPVLSSLSINLLHWVVSSVLLLGGKEPEDQLFELSSLLKLTLLDPDSYPKGFHYNYLNRSGQIYKIFEEIDEWADQIKDYLVDPETYLQSPLHLTIPRYDVGNENFESKEERSLQLLLFEPGKVENRYFDFF